MSEDIQTEKQFSAVVQQKYEKMNQKTALVLETFQLPNTERVIQDYRCALKKPNASFSGRIFITQNYLVFLSKDQQVKDSMAFYRISGITKEKTSLVIPAISVVLDTGKVLLTGFVHRDEAFNLLNHLIQYQPTYVMLQEKQLVDHIKHEMTIGRDTTQKINPQDFVKKDEMQGRWGEFEEEIKKQTTVADYEKVNLSAGDKALRTAMQINEVGAATLARLEEQAESLDRIERNIKETKNNFDRGDRILDGVSSVGGQLKNIVTPDMYRNKYGAYEAKDRTITVEEREHFTDVPILMKHSNDYLEPALLRFGDKRFICVNEDREEVKQYTYGYIQVQQIILRARHQHVDIRFHDGTERFRCCTSFVQAVVNEIILRTKHNQVTLVHEPGTKTFQYGSLAIRTQTLNASRDSSWSAEGGFVIQAPKAASADLVTEAPQEVQVQLKMQDDQINALSEAVADYTVVNDAIKKETEREVEQLKQMHKKTNSALKVANKDAYRAKKLT